MLEKTFVHVHGVGYTTERRLWAQGAVSWDAFLAEPASFKVSRTASQYLEEAVSLSSQALSEGDFRFFSSRLAPRDQWRSLEAFPGRVAYLDIETDGGIDFDNVTVVGVYDGERLQQFVRGENLLDFPEALDEAAVLVTFFGSGFDLPVLKRAFPRVPFDQLHLDLCPALRRLGLRGGLKNVERALGIQRETGVTGLSGWDAVRLWREWRWGKDESLKTLLAYNAADVLNMAPLARLAYHELSRQTSISR
jgi:uncharacterized protein YprB with RNaseH-like and TPR domain